MNTKDLKILHVIDTLGIGGAEKMAILGINTLCKKHIKVALLLLIDRGELFTELHHEVKLFELNRPKVLSYQHMKKCSEIIKTYNIVHVHMRYNYKYIRLVKVLFNLKTKIILHDHYGSIDKDISVPVFFKVFKPKYYIGVSESLTSWASNNLNMSHKAVFLLKNCILKEKVGTLTHHNKKGLVIVGNIKPIKNQLFAIQLAQALNEEITIYGKVQDAAYFKVLKNEINLLEYDNCVHFNDHTTNIQGELSKYKLALHTAKSESGPLVLIEYLAQNLRFISFSTGEVFKTIGEKYSDLFMDNFDLLAWKKQALKKTISYDLNEIYNKNFSEEKYAQDCIHIYTKMMKL
ncbi:glycosyltransferase [uncultured Algibacter sp.]|uniref:glycosyltransferase n=1 Tax=uncultured Algibacter sp. TaxID=298659 RepID=UPI00260B58F8|nr:glycosyltransferase [uncultured Algibacter sp.]